MLTRSTTRRIGAGLTAALVAVLLVTFGGSARTPASAQRTTAGPTHSSSVLHAPRLLQHVVAHSHDQPAPHLDLASSPPTSIDAPVLVSAEQSSVVHAGRVPRDLATPNGRAPPAL